MSGYFYKGRWIEVNDPPYPPIFDVMDDGDFRDLNLEHILDEKKMSIDDNLLHLPPLFNKNSRVFIGIPHLYAIYFESYLCIAYGLYSAGIIMMGQLMETTLKEIILVKTNYSFPRELGPALNYVSGKAKDSPQPWLVHPVFIERLQKFKDNFRNPYTHFDSQYKFNGMTVKGVLFEIGNGTEDICTNTKKAIEAIKNNKAKFVEIPIINDPAICETMKHDIEKRDAINSAWNIYPLFWLLVEHYLRFEDYERHNSQFGSVYSNIDVQKF